MSAELEAQQGKVRRLVFRYLSGLRFPYLFALTAALFLLDLFFPDVIPYADELLLGLATLLLSRLKKTDTVERRELPPA